jgi:hypothetical protein
LFTFPDFGDRTEPAGISEDAAGINPEADQDFTRKFARSSTEPYNPVITQTITAARTAAGGKPVWLPN